MYTGTDGMKADVIGADDMKTDDFGIGTAGEGGISYADTGENSRIHCGRSVHY